MKVELLHTQGCHVWKQVIPELVESMEQLGLEPNLKIRLIKSKKDAENNKFTGSPSIKINGKDIDPMAKKVKKYSAVSCRPYFYKGKVYDYPPKEMILKALKKA